MDRSLSRITASFRHIKDIWRNGVDDIPQALRKPQSVSVGRVEESSRERKAGLRGHGELQSDSIESGEGIHVIGIDFLAAEEDRSGVHSRRRNFIGSHWQCIGDVCAVSSVSVQNILNLVCIVNPRSEIEVLLAGTDRNVRASLSGIIIHVDEAKILDINTFVGVKDELGDGGGHLGGHCIAAFILATAHCH